MQSNPKPLWVWFGFICLKFCGSFKTQLCCTLSHPGPLLWIPGLTFGRASHYCCLLFRVSLLNSCSVAFGMSNLHLSKLWPLLSDPVVRSLGLFIHYLPLESKTLRSVEGHFLLGPGLWIFRLCLAPKVQSIQILLDSLLESLTHLTSSYLSCQVQGSACASRDIWQCCAPQVWVSWGLASLPLSGLSHRQSQEDVLLESAFAP